LIGKFFDPVQDELDRQEEAELHAVLAEAVYRRAATGWPNVDEEITELRRRLPTATTPQDHRDVGNRCVAVLEAFSVDVGARAEDVRERLAQCARKSSPGLMAHEWAHESRAAQ
jgi:hypothetical protein